MAWISGLADKAEGILNKLDQNAATALQITNTVGGIDSGESNALDAMRRGLSTSKLSLKAAFSPAKTQNTNNSYASGDAEKALGKFEQTLPDAEASLEKVEWNNSAFSSRRSSISSRAEVTIEVDDANPHSKILKKVATEGSLPNSSTLESQELLAFKIALNEVSSERDDLRARLTAMSREDEKIELLKNLQDAEKLLQRLTEERDQAQLELSNVRRTNNTYMHTISELEGNLSKLQQGYMETAHKLQMQIKETELQRKELQEYRAKAQLALQMKDQLITELKSNSALDAENSISGVDSDLKLLQLEFDGLKQEHNQTLQECNSLRIQLEELRSDWQSIIEQHAKHLADARLTEEELRKELRTERQRLLSSESEQRIQSQELVKLRQQLSNQMAAAATHLQEKETQLQKMRAELMQRNAKTKSAEDGMLSIDADERIKALTQTLVDKQHTVEQITTERNALRFQLEKIQDQLQQQYAYNNTAKQASRNVLLSNTTDDVKAQFPLLMRENPFDNRVARRVKRAYSSLDSVGIRLGAFLRRYPLMRIFVLLYVGLLHLWVVFVLISSSPN